MTPQPSSPASSSVASAEITLRTLLDSVSDGVALTTPDQRVVECNAAFRAMVGLDAHRPLGNLTCHGLLAGSTDPCENCPSHLVFEQGQTVRCHPSLAVAAGPRREFDLRSFPLRDAAGNITHELKIVRDVTHDRERDRELDEKRRLATLGEMSARLAHEVKNPLAGMRGALQILGRRRGAEDPERDVFDELIAHIDRLNSTVEDLLSFARTPSVRLENTECVDVIDAAFALVRANPDLVDVHLEREDHGAGVVPLDRQQIVQVLTNLVLNAVQALRPGDPRKVSVTSRPGRPGTVMFEIRDHGPGIPAALRERLFTPFFTTKSRGTGLGLAISRKIAEAHGGTMDYECPPAGGTVFRLFLPRQELVAPVDRGEVHAFRARPTPA